MGGHICFILPIPYRLVKAIKMLLGHKGRSIQITGSQKKVGNTGLQHIIYDKANWIQPI